MDTFLETRHKYLLSACCGCAAQTDSFCKGRYISKKESRSYPFSSMSGAGGIQYSLPEVLSLLQAEFPSNHYRSSLTRIEHRPCKIIFKYLYHPEHGNELCPTPARQGEWRIPNPRFHISCPIRLVLKSGKQNNKPRRVCQPNEDNNRIPGEKGEVLFDSVSITD